MHILHCVYKLYMLYTVAYIECMPTNVYMYVHWIAWGCECAFFFYKLIVFYIIVYIEVCFCQSALNYNMTDN
jgi:hypothetical protein